VGGRGRRGRAGLAALAVGLAVAGCGQTAGPPKGSPYWLVRVGDNFATVYQYAHGYHPGTAHAVFLGDSVAAEHANLKSAAARLGVPVSHIQPEPN
jgi:hypothetical protein